LDCRCSGFIGADLQRLDSSIVTSCWCCKMKGRWSDGRSLYIQFCVTNSVVRDFISFVVSQLLTGSKARFRY
jgi:hypothetical protein